MSSVECCTGSIVTLGLDCCRRNELVALDLFVTAVMAMFAFVSMIGGIFGMNMKNGHEESTVISLNLPQGGISWGEEPFASG